MGAVAEAVDLLSPSWSRTAPTNRATPPAAGSATAARTSSTSSGSSRMSTSDTSATPRRAGPAASLLMPSSARYIGKRMAPVPRQARRAGRRAADRRRRRRRTVAAPEPVRGNAVRAAVLGVHSGSAPAAGLPDLSALIGQMQQMTDAARRLGQLGAGQGHARDSSPARSPTPPPRRASRRRSPTPCGWPSSGSTGVPTSRPAPPSPRRGAARSGSRRPAPVWRTRRRAGRRARRRRDGEGHAGRGQGDGRPADRAAQPGRQRDVRPADRPGRWPRWPARSLSSTDIGLPLAPSGTAALLPANVAAFGEGLEPEPADVLLYSALRECAHQRLFHHVPWLRAAPARRGRGLRPRHHASTCPRSRKPCGGLDPTDPQAMQEALTGGLFEPRSTPEQQPALARLETVLALVEGWVDEVVEQATGDRMPRPPALREAVRRRRAAGGPAEQTFAVAGRPRAPAAPAARRHHACGARCATGRVPRPATPCGSTPT